jgi:hypothetical protein
VKTLLFAAGLVAACTLNAADFRNATWGMSPEQVIKSEKVKLEDDKDDPDSYLAGNLNLLGHKASVAYLFKYKKLYHALYDIKFTKKNNLKLARKTLAKLATILKKKYGTENIKERLVYGDRYKGKQNTKPTIKNFDQFEAEFVREWHLPRTTIKLILQSDKSYRQTTEYWIFVRYEVANKKQVFSKWEENIKKREEKQAENEL